MTLILETPDSDIHRCPGCGANCAVDRTMVTRAADAGQQVRIACHKCAEIFRPLADNPDSPSRQNASPKNPRVGLCTKCHAAFSVPALGVDDSVVVECPHCRHHMAPDEIGRADARREILPEPTAVSRLKAGNTHQPRRWRRMLWSLLIGGAVLAGVAVAALERLTPDSIPFAGLTAPLAPRLAITDTDFTLGDSGDDGNGSVLVTVTLSNLGTAAGAPEWVTVKLLDANGTVLSRRPIASREMTLAPGTSRTLVSRMSAVPGQVADMVVELTRD